MKITTQPNKRYITGMYDPDSRLDHNNQSIGGTQLTNFDYEQIEIYKKAIEIYNQSDPKTTLVISKFAYDANGNKVNLYSLHMLERCDMSDFWMIFDSLKH